MAKRPIVRHGDRTTHGGTVISSDLTYTIDGKPVARVGDMVACRRYKGTFAIVIRKAEQIDLSNFGHISYHYAIACDGTIYEALDIREKGAHVASGNTGVIGVVVLADLSAHGEAYKEEYASKSLLGKMRGIFEWGPDKLDTTRDEPPENQIKALFALVNILRNFFPITMLGGHREYQKLSTGEGRACPGAYGMILVDMLRREFKLGEPHK